MSVLEPTVIGVTSLHHRHNIPGAEGPENCASCEITRLRAERDAAQQEYERVYREWLAEKAEAERLRAEVDEWRTEAKRLLGEHEHQVSKYDNARIALGKAEAEVERLTRENGDLRALLIRPTESLAVVRAAEALLEASALGVLDRTSTIRELSDAIAALRGWG